MWPGHFVYHEDYDSMNRSGRLRKLPIDLAWVGVIGITGLLIALLIIPSWQNTTLTNLRERTPQY
jgi:hypothetical protein